MFITTLQYIRLNDKQKDRRKGHVGLAWGEKEQNVGHDWTNYRVQNNFLIK